MMGGVTQTIPATYTIYAYTIYIVCIMCLGCILLASTPSLAALTPDEQLADPILESRAQALTRDLRCLVCQNQSVYDSNAPFAIAVRALIRQEILAGSSDADIIKTLRANYGDYILFSPPVNRLTIWLWVSPFLLLLGGAGWIYYTHHTQRQQQKPPKP